MNPFKKTTDFDTYLYTTEDLAKAMNCSGYRVRKLVREGKIHPILPTVILIHPAENKRSRFGAFRFTRKELERASKLYRLSWLKRTLLSLGNRL